MSADDFQTKYASVMDGMLKSAVSETTKLFETMVDELKAEISRLKKENDDLKTKCIQFENAKSPASVYSRENEPLPGTSGGFEKRDTAIQCELGPLRTMLVEQCQPLRDSSLPNQEQQWRYEEMEHNYVSHREPDSQMAYIQVKQEDDDDSLQSVLKEEEDKPTLVYGQFLSNKKGSTQASTCGAENEGPCVNQEHSTGEVLVPQKDEETTVALERPSLQMDSDLQGVHNQSATPEHSLVISLATIKDDMEEESEIHLKISEVGTQAELITSDEHPLALAEHQSDVEPSEIEQPSVVIHQREMSVSKQTDVTVQQYGNMHCIVEQLAEPSPQNKDAATESQKACSTEDDSSSQPVRRKRGRPPKRSKRLQQSVKVLQSSSTFTTTEQEVVSLADDTVNSTASKSPKVTSVKSKTSSIVTRSVQESVNAALAENFNNQECASLLESAIQAPSSEVSSATETLNTSTPRHRRSSVTLQDAMLLVEAMNQSTAENSSSAQQKLAVPPQTRGVPLVGKLQTVDEIPTKPSTALLPVIAHGIAGKLPATKLSTLEHSRTDTLKASTKTKDAAPNNEVQAELTGVLPNQQHMVTLSKTSSLPLSSAASQTSVGLPQQHNLHALSSVAPNKPSNAAHQKIIVVPRLASHKIAALSSTHLPCVVTTVGAGRSTSLLPASTAAGLPLETPSLSSVLQKAIYVTSGKLLPVVSSQSIATSRDQQPGTQPQSKITIIFPRQSQSRPFVHTTKQNSAVSASTVMVTAPQLSSSQELKVSLDAQTTSDEVAALLSQKRDNTDDSFESPKQTTTVPESPNALTETCLSTSVRQGLASLFPVTQPKVQQKLSAIVRLTRLPFPVSTTESVLVSKLISEGCSETSTTQKFVSTQPSEICPILKETSVAVSVNTCQMLEETNDPPEKASVSSKMSILGGTRDSSNSQPSTHSVSTVVNSVAEPSADGLTCNLKKEIISNTVQNCTQPNMKEKQSATSIELTTVTSKDTSDPHLQMTKTQFLAQLAVSPIDEASEKASDNDFADVAACGKNKLQETSLVARLRSHLKSHPQFRRAEPCPEPCMETKTTTVSPKKLRLDGEGPDDNNNNSEPVPVSPNNRGVVEDVASLNKTTNDPTSISPVKSGFCKDDVTSKRSVSELTTANSRWSSITSVSSGTGSKSKQSNSESPRRYTSTKLDTSTKNTTFTSVSPRRTSSNNDHTSPKNTKSTSVSPRRTISAKDGTSPKNTKSTCVTPRRASAVRDGANPKIIKSTCVNPKNTRSTRDSASPKNAKSTYVSPRRTSSTRDGLSSPKTKSLSASPGMSKSTIESTFGSPRRSSFIKVGTKQIKRESNSFSPMRFKVMTESGLPRQAKSETASPSARWLGKDHVSPKRTGESTPAKKPRLSQDGTGPKRNLRVVNAKKLAKAAKAKTIAKIKFSKQQSLQNGAETSVLAGNQANSQAVRKCKSKAIWIPPKMPITNTPKKETKSVVLCLPPIPVRAPPMVSPLQPLLVIGGHLLKNQCGECGRILSSSAALESHVGLHTGHRPFSCTLCGKSFPDSKGLKRHGRVHRNGRIHVCQQCGKGFVYRFGLTKHLQMVHSRLKPFVCQICNKGFYTKRDVEAHIRIHTGEKPFHCNLCEKKFTRRVELNVHLRWHNGEKRHWCPYCGKGFLDFNNLKRHKYIHTGEKPHSCPHCPKRFTQSGHLKKHVKNVHKIE